MILLSTLLMHLGPSPFFLAYFIYLWFASSEVPSLFKFSQLLLAYACFISVFLLNLLLLLFPWLLLSWLIFVSLLFVISVKSLLLFNFLQQLFLDLFFPLFEFAVKNLLLLCFLRLLPLLSILTSLVVNKKKSFWIKFRNESRSQSKPMWHVMFLPRRYTTLLLHKC